ncbi:hypothetical protein F4820DRAFT_395698 [Hypoxylon rubiginosum]|uniref:Uncharacterized protein n=1 Tax=Hypoxylon rubiginosum TaxID=110542 RepID=A0ACB9YUI2_9PEZI|nr:hypothetical protein F4820DRAFT_395698 [Hypoxylon rubiginosum]
MHPGSYLFLITALAGLLVLGNSKFSVDLCPLYHLSEITDDSKTNTHDLKFVAMCSNTGKEYQMSSLNITECINNNQAKLTDADQQNPYPGPFSGSCIGCGIATTKDDGDNDDAWRLSLRCQCAYKDRPDNFQPTDITLDDIIDVSDTGFVTCDGMDDEVINGDPVSAPPNFPLDAGMTTSTSTSTTTSPPSTLTVTTTEKTTVTNTTPAPSSVCPSPASVTVTKTHKKVKTKTKTETETETETKKKTKTKTKTKTETETATKKFTETALINVQVTVFTATVYTTPPPSLLIRASLQTTVKAILTTITVPAQPTIIQVPEPIVPAPEPAAPAPGPPVITSVTFVQAPEPPAVPEGAI